MKLGASVGSGIITSGEVLHTTNNELNRPVGQRERQRAFYGQKMRPGLPKTISRLFLRRLPTHMMSGNPALIRS
jgi:hypothetical protein